MNQQINEHPLFSEGGEGKFSSSSLFIKGRDEPLSITMPLSNQISTSIDKASTDIVSALLSPPKAPFLSATLITALLSTLLATSAAFGYNKLHWYSVIKRESRIKIIESITDVVNELREDAITYWLKGYSRKGAKILLEEEMRIKAHLSLINSLVTDYLSLASKRNKEFYTNKLKGFHGELFDSITGGDFESKTRKQSKDKANAISAKCVAFKVFLNTIKL